MAGNAGRGYVNGNAGQTLDNATYIDRAVACDADGWVTTIKVNLYDNANTLKIGCGYLSGSTFYMRNYVTIDTTGDGTGQLTYTAPTDFTAFQMYAGDWIVFYSNSTGYVTIDRTITGPTGHRFANASGDQMDEVSFETSSSSASDIEFEFQGSPLGWTAGTMNGADMAKLNGVAVADIASVNGV
jgi:hypothetical protein